MIIDQRTRLVLTGALVVVAGCISRDPAGRPTVIGVGVILIGVALYADIMRIASSPVVLRVIRRRPIPPIRRGGLGPENANKPRKSGRL